MKGLLLKDWYMVIKYCKHYAMISVLFLVASFFNSETLFFVFYPCLLCGMIPVTLLGYDERSGFLQYGDTLPYTRTQIVSSKYIIGLLVQLVILLATAAVQGVRMMTSGTFLLDELCLLLSMMLSIATISSSLCLPFIFKSGIEKGRIAYYVMIGIVCGGGVIASKVFDTSSTITIPPVYLSVLLAAVGLGVYALSWYVSVIFYKKREL